MSSWLEQAEAMRGKAITPQRHNTYDSNIAELKKNVNEFLSEEAKETEHKDAEYSYRSGFGVSTKTGETVQGPSGSHVGPSKSETELEERMKGKKVPVVGQKDTWPNEKATEAPGGEQGRPPSREGFDETNHLGEKVYKTFAVWKAAVKAVKPDAKIEGNSSVANAPGAGEWDGKEGVIYSK